MRSRKYRALSIATMLLMVAFLAFSAGCKGDKGKAGVAGEAGEQGATGEDGVEGPPGPQLAAVGEEVCSTCHGEGAIADVEVVHGLTEPDAVFGTLSALDVTFGTLTVAAGSGNTNVLLTIKDQDGNPVSGLTTANVTGRDFRFIIAQLTPASGNISSYWENYVLDSNDNPSYEAGTSSGGAGNAGTLTETGGAGTGMYTYAFKTAITDSTDVTYSAGKEQRVAFQTGGVLPSNQFYADYPGGGGGPDAQDSGDGVPTAAFARAIVNEANCNDCHNPLELHGSRRKTGYCQVCHTPQNEGGAGDLKVFIHKIHRGRYLPSVVAGGSYSFPDADHDFSDVGFPMYPLSDGLGIENCAKCHSGTASPTEEGDNWKTQPNAEVCTSCHDDVNPLDGTNHTTAGAVAANSCANAGCHAVGASKSPENAHKIPANLLAAQKEVAYTITDATYSAGSVAVTFYAENTNDSSKWNLSSGAPFQSGASLTMSIAWDSGTDISNTGSGSTPSRSLDTNVLSALGTSAVADNGNGTYTITIALPDEAQAAGSGMAFTQGHPLGDGDGDGTADAGETMDVAGTNAFFKITDSSVKARRDVVDIAKCDSCHGFVEGHGGLRSDNAQVCAGCHNPNNTDIGRRPEDPADAVDGKAEESVDFKRMIHAIHASGKRENPLAVYGFSGPAVFDEEEVTFPGELNKCTACHSDPSSSRDPQVYWLPLADGILASTIDTGEDVADPADDLNITPNAAVCSSCHDSEKAATHMEQNGASFEVLDENILFY